MHTSSKTSLNVIRYLIPVVTGTLKSIITLVKQQRTRSTGASVACLKKNRSLTEIRVITASLFGSQVTVAADVVVMWIHSCSI